ncbi:TetR/AcrR family transcriptional regulator [Gordonia sp. NPDC003424]
MATRRRGVELETAIYAAVLAELSESGYSAMTFEGVAARAGTSKAVLYRRWATKGEMVIAALSDSIRPFAAPDTGSLHGDLVATLKLLRSHITLIKRRTVLGLLTDLDTDVVTDVQDLLMTRSREILGPAINRARVRGELTDDAVPERLVSLPFDLSRHDLLFGGSLPDTRIEEIVGDVVLPVWTVGHQGEQM